MPLSGIRPHTPSKREAADLRLRPRSLRDRQIERFTHFEDTILYYQKKKTCTDLQSCICELLNESAFAVFSDPTGINSIPQKLRTT